MKSLFTIVFFLSLFAVKSNSATLPYSRRMADAQITRSGAITSWDYPNGLFIESILKVYAEYGGANYYNYALNYAKATVNSSTGKIASGYSFTAYTLDNINPGMFLMSVYATENASQYKIALDTLRKQLQTQPRTNNSLTGGFWHKKSYPHQMWMDGLYMGTRFYANYEKTFNNGAAYDDIVNQFVLIHSHTYDPAYQLNYHAWSAMPTDANSFWANQTAPFLGCSKEFWARGIGWYAAALVDVLEIMPASYSRRQELVDILNQVAAGIKRWQDPASGCWYQLIRYDNTLVSNGTANYLEASASCMFTYALLKAVRLGLLPKADYQSTGTKGYQGLISKFITEDTSGNLSLNRICSSAGLGPSSNLSRNGTVDYYLNGSDAGVIVSNDLKGVGPFIMASVEYEKLQATTTGDRNVFLLGTNYQIMNKNNTLTIKSASSGIHAIIIYSVQGVEINHWQGKDTTEISIPVPNFHSGVYLLKINDLKTERILLE